MALSTVHVFIQDRGLLNEFHCICDKELLKQVQSPDFKPFWFLFGKKRTKTVQVFVKSFSLKLQNPVYRIHCLLYDTQVFPQTAEWSDPMVTIHHPNGQQ